MVFSQKSSMSCFSVWLPWCKVVFWIHKWRLLSSVTHHRIYRVFRWISNWETTNPQTKIWKRIVCCWRYRWLCIAFHYEPPRCRLAIQSHACKLNTCNTLHFIKVHYLTSPHLTLHCIIWHYIHYLRYIELHTYYEGVLKRWTQTSLTSPFYNDQLWIIVDLGCLILTKLTQIP